MKKNEQTRLIMKKYAVIFREPQNIPVYEWEIFRGELNILFLSINFKEY